MNKLSRSSIIEILRKKYPKNLAEKLMELLYMEREAIYRRLRAESSFTAEQLLKIASEWNISLDEITGNKPKQTDLNWLSLNHTDPSELDLNYVQNIINHLNNINNYQATEFMEVSNKLTSVLIAEYEYITKYQLLKLACQYTHKDMIRSFSETVMPEKLSSLMKECNSAMKNTKQTIYIWDSRVFKTIVRDVQYFQSMHLITDEERELVKNDLFALLDYLEKVCIIGFWPETSNEVQLYISNIDIESNYSYYYSEGFKLCRIHALGKSEIHSYSPVLIENIKSFIRLKKQMSDLISGASGKSRVEFFDKQREIIAGL